MPEIDLMRRYPKSDRSKLLSQRPHVDSSTRDALRKFEKDYFDGDRTLGLGGYYYNPKFFSPVVEDMIAHYKIAEDASILDVGCAKGFMLHDFKRYLPRCEIAGFDISRYCLENAMDDVKEFLMLGTCEELPYDSNSYDLVVSIATIHNLDLGGVKRSLREIERVKLKHAFIKVNGYRNEEERDLLERWNLVAKTILHVDEWRAIFKEVGYTGDYAFFLP